MQFSKSIQETIFHKNLQDENIVYLVAMVKTVTVGFLSCHFQRLLHHGGLVGEIQEMAVDPPYRGIGVGSLMLEKLEILSLAKGAIQLEVSSNLRRIDAHRFYEKSGYRKTSLKLVKAIVNRAG
jgi:PhnO protein